VGNIGAICDLNTKIFLATKKRSMERFLVTKHKLKESALLNYDLTLVRALTWVFLAVGV
jgi:hypothetical protein